MALTGFLLVALVVVTMTVFRERAKDYRTGLLANQATYVERLVEREVSAASLITSPAPGGDANILTGWKNQDPRVNPSATQARMIASQQARYFHFCVIPSTGPMFYYAGDWPMPFITCGSPPPSGNWETVAGTPLGLIEVPPPLFRRPCQDRNGNSFCDPDEKLNNLVEFQMELRISSTVIAQEITKLVTAQAQFHLSTGWEVP